MPHLDANGLHVHVQVIRQPQADEHAPRPKVVMIHGLVADNLSSFFYTIANRVALDADVYLYDLRGHGRTETPKTGYALVDFVADLRAVLTAWQIDDEPVHLLGNSFGCAISLAYTHMFPEQVASLTLLEAHFATEGWGEHMAGSLALCAFGLDEEGMQEWLRRNATRKLTKLVQRSERLFLETSLIDDLQKERPFPNQSLETITCPALVLYGEGSDVLEKAHHLHRHLPNCELHVVPEATHALLFEATPFVRERTVEWITRHHTAVMGSR